MASTNGADGHLRADILGLLNSAFDLGGERRDNNCDVSAQRRLYRAGYLYPRDAAFFSIAMSASQENNPKLPFPYPAHS